MTVRVTPSRSSSAMSDRPIAFFDSGLGGIPYMLATRARAPGERLVYYADTASFPYGDRSEMEVRRIVRDAVARIMELAYPRLIVIACNTASVVGLDELRRQFDVPFVGVVPAIKPAIERGASDPVGVLATSRTVRGAYLAGLIRRFAPTARIELVAADELVRVIEHRLGALDERELGDILRPSIDRLRAAGVRTIVLGCTHFIHVRGFIEHLAGPHVTVVDSVEGVVRQTIRLLRGAAPGGDVGPGDRGPAPLVLVSGPAGSSYRFIASAHGLQLCEPATLDGLPEGQR